MDYSRNTAAICMDILRLSFAPINNFTTLPEFSTHLRTKLQENSACFVLRSLDAVIHFTVAMLVSLALAGYVRPRVMQNPLRFSNKNQLQSFKAS